MSEEVSTPRRRLGRTELSVPLLGLGTGTRFGDRRRLPRNDCEWLVRGALDMGIDYIDTAPMYHEAEAMLGEALMGVGRERYRIATKFFPRDAAGEVLTPAGLRTSVETSLRRLRVDCIDVLQVHGLRPAWREPVMNRLGEELERLRAVGRFRFLGVAETIVEDPRHDMLPAAAKSGRFDQALVGYHPFSPWAEVEALPACRQADLGVVAMVVVGPTLRNPALLAERLRAARERSEAGPMELAEDDSLEWLLDEYGPSLVAAAYRFAAGHPAVATVLSGTLSLEHLRENLAAVSGPPLSPDALEKLRRVFLRTDPREWIIRHL